MRPNSLHPPDETYINKEEETEAIKNRIREAANALKLENVPVTRANVARKLGATYSVFTSFLKGKDDFIKEIGLTISSGEIRVTDPESSVPELKSEHLIEKVRENYVQAIEGLLKAGSPVNLQTIADALPKNRGRGAGPGGVRSFLYQNRDLVARYKLEHLLTLERRPN